MADDLEDKPRVDGAGGTMISGLYLEGAQFNLSELQIEETAVLGSTAFKMPIIVLTPTVTQQ